MSKEKKSVAKQTIIVHKKMEFHEIKVELSKSFKIRENKNPSEVADIIFPTFGLAFMVIDLEKFMSEKNQERILSALISLKSQFQHSYVLLIISKRSITGMLNFQKKLLGNGPHIIPVISCKNAATVISELSRSEERKDRIQQREKEISLLTNSIDQIGSSILVTIPGLSTHEADVLLAGMKSISRIATSPAEEIYQNTPLEYHKAVEVKRFFEKDEPL